MIANRLQNFDNCSCRGAGPFVNRAALVGAIQVHNLIVSSMFIVGVIDLLSILHP